MSIVVVGSINVDLVMRTERAPEAGETLAAHGYSIGVGGKGLNQCAAIKLQSESRNVGMVACIGDDEYGKLCLSEITRLGVDVSSVVQLHDSPTGVASIVVEDSGDNRILLSSGANSKLSTDMVDRAHTALTTASIAVFQLEIPLTTVRYAVHKAHSAGVRTVLNPAPGTRLPDDLLEEVSYLIPNESEAAILSQMPVTNVEQAIAAGKSLLDRGVQEAVIITLGDQGCVSITKTDAKHMPAQTVKAIDTTA